MDYIISDEQGRIIARTNTRPEAMAAGYKWVEDWRRVGCPNVRHFRVYWNGTKPETVYDSRRQGKATR